MALDLDNSYKRLRKSIESVETFNQVLDSEKQSQSQQQSSLEKSSEETLSPLDQLKEQKKRYQRQVESQLDKLLNINKLLPNDRYTGKTATSTSSFIKNSFSEALNQVKSKLPEIIQEEMLKQLGCTQEQTYSLGPFYIPVESIDLAGNLKEAPDSTVGKLFYEKPPIVIQNSPFSMNKELYNRIQNPGLSYNNEYGKNYKGASSQELFNFTYVQQDANGNNGNFYKVDLIPRENNKNLVGQFLTDYFKSIQLVDTKNIFLQVFQIIFGSISIQLKQGQGQILDFSYFQRIMTRVLGLCFDNRSEIDVSGIAKVAPLDGVDDSFFELTDVDLRLIESKLSNIQQGVFEYIDCTNVKQPLNVNELFDTLLLTLDVDDNNSAENTAIFNQATQTIKDKTLGPKFELGVKIDDDIISTLPQAIFAAVITPKVLFPFMILIKALESTIANIQTSAVNVVYNYESFVRTYKKFVIEVVSRITAEFVKILRDIIVRDVRKLLKALTRDLKKNQITKKYAIIAQLLEASILITQLVTDYRKCKSVVDDILNIIEFALRGADLPTPPFLRPLAALRTGFNDTRAMLEVIKTLQKNGIPTGPMPDGSPNLYLLAIKSQIEGIELERTKNGKTESLAPQQVVLPIGITVPQPFASIIK